MVLGSLVCCVIMFLFVCLLLYDFAFTFHPALIFTPVMLLFSKQDLAGAQDQGSIETALGLSSFGPAFGDRPNTSYCVIPYSLKEYNDIERIFRALLYTYREFQNARL